MLWAVSRALWYSTSRFNSPSAVLNPNLDSLLKFKFFIYSLSTMPDVLLLSNPPCRPAILPLCHFLAFPCIWGSNRALWDQTRPVEPQAIEDLKSPNYKMSNLKHWGWVSVNISFDNRFYLRPWAHIAHHPIRACCTLNRKVLRVPSYRQGRHPIPSFLTVIQLMISYEDHVPSRFVLHDHAIYVEIPVWEGISTHLHFQGPSCRIS